MDYNIKKGNDRFLIFEELIKEKKHISMHLLDYDYKYVTFVVDIKEIDGSHFFLADYPENFYWFGRNIETCKMFFEFKGADGLLYSFNTNGTVPLNDKMWIRVPDYIERQQRRKSFRVDPPSGTKVICQTGSDCYEMDVIDISTGGVFLFSGSFSRNENTAQIFHMGDILTDIKLIFSWKGERQEIFIKTIEIKRIDKNSTLKRYYYAVEFVEIDKGQKMILNRFVYKFQRHFLRNRRH